MRSYRRFMQFMGDSVLEVLRVMENEAWHHEEIHDEKFQAYARQCGILAEIVERAKHYVHEKGGTGEERLSALKRAAAEDGLDRLFAERGSRDLWAGGVQLELDDHFGDQAGGNGSEGDPGIHPD